MGSGVTVNQPPTGDSYVWPIPIWPTASPAAMGMNDVLLEQAKAYATQTYTAGGSGCIIRHGYVVKQWGSVTNKYDLKSTTKSIGGTALLLALGDGKLSLDTPAQQLHPSFGLPPDSNAATGWLDDITKY